MMINEEATTLFRLEIRSLKLALKGGQAYEVSF